MANTRICKGGIGVDKIVYLAVAGSGKTYNLCNRIDEDKRNIIIAFTNQNLKNIRKELMDKFGYIPKNTDIMTYHSFIYRDILMPYEYIAWNKVERKNKQLKRNTKGITIVEPPPQPSYINGVYTPSPYYTEVKYIEHYLDIKTKQYYCSRISKLINKCGIKGIIEKAIRRLELFYDNLYIDEFQDFRSEDYKLLNNITKRIDINCYLYGDYYQHSVSGTNNSGLPFSLKGKSISYDDFVEELQNNNYTVDTALLQYSRRCPDNICEYIRNKLIISIFSENSNSGEIKHLKDKSEIRRVLSDENIIKLFYRDSKRAPFKAINWGYSKGDTYKETCIILTQDLNLDSLITRNKFYVALTRSKGDVYLLEKSRYDMYIESGSI